MKGVIFRIFFVLSMLLIPINIHASEVVEINPKEILVKETDIGKSFEISLKNNSDKPLSLEAQEVRINRLNNEILNVDTGKEVLEMGETKILIEAGSTFSHKIRIKFSSQDFANSYPAVKYLSADNSSELIYKIEDQVIFLIQNLDGEYKLGLDVKLSNPDITTSNNVRLLASVKNEGAKYFIPDGTFSIYFKDQLIFEKKLTELMNKRLFSQDEISFEVEHELEDTTWQAVGEYRIEVKVNSDYSANQKIANITFMYIPDQIISMGGILIGGVILLFLITALIRKSKNR